MKNKKIIITIIAITVVGIAAAIIVFLNNKNDNRTVDVIGIDTTNESLVSPNRLMTKGNGGYYYVEYKSGAELIKFFDPALNASVPICGKVDCTHDSNNCNAYFDMYNYIIGTIYSYKNYLYKFELVNGMAVLVRVSPDGATRERIAEIMPNDNRGTLSAVFYEDCAYIYDNYGGYLLDEEHTEVIVKVDLNTKKKEIVYEYTAMKAAICNAKTNGSKMFFLITEYKKTEDLYGVTDVKGVYYYDYDTQESGLLYEGNVTSYFFDNEEKYLYYMKRGEGVYKKSLESGKESVVYAVNDKVITGQISFDGKYIYVCNGGFGSLTDMLKAIPQLCIVIDRDGNVVDEFGYHASVSYLDNDYIFDLSLMGNYYMEKSKIGNGAEWIEF